MKEASFPVPPLFNRPAAPVLILLSGSSGAGKDTVASHLMAADPTLERIITVTTRSPRPGEKDCVDYHFVSSGRFQEMLAAREFLEWAHVYGYWYGVPLRAVQEKLAAGCDVLIKVDIQGAATIKKVMPHAIGIFVAPPSMEELGIRLERRRTESSEDRALRRATAEEEIKQLHLFDYVVLNEQDKIEAAVAAIKAIITAEKCRIKRLAPHLTNGTG
jgi:guanylate kinase